MNGERIFLRRERGASGEMTSTQRRRERRAKRREAKTRSTEGVGCRPYMGSRAERAEEESCQFRRDCFCRSLDTATLSPGSITSDSSALSCAAFPGFLCAYLCVLCVSALNSSRCSVPASPSKGD